MGVEESKLAVAHRYADQYLHSCSHVKGGQWVLIHTSTLDEWKRKYRALFNFYEDTMECPYNRPSECTVSFCLSKQNIINLSKRRGPFSFHKHRKQSKLAEHFEYNHIPAHLSSVQNLHFKSILCTHDGLAIVHLARNLITQFGIVDLHIHKFLGTFGRQTVKYSTDSVAAQISPDGSLCLVRLPWSRTNRITTLQLYNLRTKELVTELPLTTDNIRFRPVPPPPPPPPQPQPPSLRLPFVHPFLTLGWTTPDDLENQTRSSQSARRPAPNEVEEEEAEVRVRAFGGYNQPASILFDFDPRFENSRIALANVHFVEPQRPDCPTLRRYSLVEGFFEGQEPILCLVRLPSWQRIAKTRNFGETPEPRVGSVGAGNLRGRGTSDGAFNSATATGINILKVFYSRAGHLIFAVVATTMSCRCNSLAQGLLFSPFHPSGTDATGSTSAPDVSEHYTCFFSKCPFLCLRFGIYKNLRRNRSIRSKSTNNCYCLLKTAVFTV
uniref:SOCS box domain-containing protein n=1 Tax=Mesocestoides corti TaxID=53468 RepID=A0A5K3FHE3_MESCO